MFGKNDTQQQWSVHAEFTISHPGANDPENLPQTHTEQGNNGVKMTYTWSTPGNPNNNNTPWSSPPSGSVSNRSTSSDPPKHYAFQRGNLFFTSTPPRRPFNFADVHRLGIHDSGYGSDLLSPNSQGGCLLPRRPIQPYNRKCRSTCNIVLSTNIQDENRTEDNSDSTHTQCGRTRSLRCQTPTMRCDNRTENFYGCGDPWCHHLHYGDDFSCGGRFSPVMETCEDVLSGQASTKSYGTARCCEPSRHSVPKDMESRKDASVQTSEMIDKATSPYLKVGSFDYNKSDDERKRDNSKTAKKMYGSSHRRRTEPIFQRSHSPSSITPDSLDNLQIPQRLSRSPQLERVPASHRGSREKESEAETKSSDTSKKPRTVHIDVYCTGTEMESDASNSSDSSNNETASTPQTVFESEKVRVTHKRAEEKQLPYHIQRSKSKSVEKKIIENPQEDSDNDDGASTAYPSKLSSYSTIRDFSSSISSVPQSWTTYSMSSCTVPEDYDSVANTSWKDTFSDIDSLMQSRSSIAKTDSLDFMARRLSKNPSIDETPEIERKDLLDTPSRESLQPSDSFEYANSEDRIRIRKMEEFWKNKSPNIKQWKSPQTERRLMLQQRKIKEYMDRRQSDKNLLKCESKETDSEASDDSEKGWTFIKEENEEPIKAQDDKTKSVTSNIPQQFNTIEISKPKVNKSPSIAAIQERLSADPTLRAPFTIVPGVYTDQRAVARRFGSIVTAMRKPGHHIGPAKNPDCLCDHCQRFFANIGYNRGRTRSMGDPPSYQVHNWKDLVRYPTTESNSNISVPSQFPDF